MTTGGTLASSSPPCPVLAPERTSLALTGGRSREQVEAASWTRMTPADATYAGTKMVREPDPGAWRAPHGPDGPGRGATLCPHPTVVKGLVEQDLLVRRRGDAGLPVPSLLTPTLSTAPERTLLTLPPHHRRKHPAQIARNTSDVSRTSRTLAARSRRPGGRTRGRRAPVPGRRPGIGRRRGGWPTSNR